MTRASVCLVLAAIVGGVLLSLAFVVAPRWCRGGLDAYLWSGAGAIAGLAVAPFAIGVGDSLPGRVAWAAALAVAGAAVWAAGPLVIGLALDCGAR